MIDLFRFDTHYKNSPSFSYFDPLSEQPVATTITKDGNVTQPCTVCGYLTPWFYRDQEKVTPVCSFLCLSNLRGKVTTALTPTGLVFTIPGTHYTIRLTAPVFPETRWLSSFAGMIDSPANDLIHLQELIWYVYRVTLALTSGTLPLA